MEVKYAHYTRRVHSSARLNKANARTIGLIKRQLCMTPMHGLSVHVYRNRVIVIRDVRRLTKLMTIQIKQGDKTHEFNVDMDEYEAWRDLQNSFSWTSKPEVMEHGLDLIGKYRNQTDEEIAS